MARYMILNDTITEADPPEILSKDTVIYEVARIMNRSILFLEDHLDRLELSFHQLKIPLPHSRHFIQSKLALLTEINQFIPGNIRFQYILPYLGIDFDFYAFYIPHSYPSKDQYENGVDLVSMEAVRENPMAKVQHSELNMAVNRLIQETRRVLILFTHPDGFITEGSRSNFFMIQNATVYTAPYSDVLPGITRKYVIDVCKAIGIPLIERRISLEKLETMDAVFLAGTSPKILPVRKIDSKSFEVQNKILRKIMREYDKIIFHYCELNESN